MIAIRKKLCASTFALALGALTFTSAGCIDNSGNKTYPRPDAGTDVAATDTEADTPTSSDAPAGDITPGEDLAGDRPGDTTVGGDAGDALRSDLRVDLPAAG
ncbi:MAG TPA: hypothetical protein VFH68_03970 [Polyangia bacterium]|jgi:hypothetical protein|nr:hypothetical protein [Polyangia bacterium]